MTYITKAYAIMKDARYDNSGVMPDYFDYALHNHIVIGKCDKPYQLTA